MSNQSVPVEKFGKDHWSMLAYVEHCCVEGKAGVGTLVLERVRCNENTHPLMAVNRSVIWKDSYGTRLAGFFDFDERSDHAKAAAAGLMLLEHDDWDCLGDLEVAGYCEVLSLASGQIKMTPLGMSVSAKLREHKANGGQFAQFVAPFIETGSAEPSL